MHLARLLRKRPINAVNNAGVDNGRSPSSWKASNAPLIIGYFITFSYAASLSPSILPGVVFIACITSLLSELCKYEFLTCKRGTSTCVYTCVYQILGELPAYIYGWSFLINKALLTSLVARGLGSILVLTIGEGLRRHFGSTLVDENVFGIAAQFIVASFILCGLQLTSSLIIVSKIITLGTLLLFTGVVVYYSTGHAAEQSHPKQEQFLASAAILLITFTPDNQQLKDQSKFENVSFQLAINYCTHLLILVIMAIVLCLLPNSILCHFQSTWPLLEVLTNLTKGSHWFIVTFSCLCIPVASLSLVETILDGDKHAVKMAADGLLPHQIARDKRAATVFMFTVSVLLECSLSTLNLVYFLAIIHSGFDSLFGLVVTYRRYCTSLPITNQLKNMRNKLGKNENRQPITNESESDDTDIEAAVDEYKTQMYVSTIMPWQNPEGLHHNNPFRKENSSKTSTKIQTLLLSLAFLIFTISITLKVCDASNPLIIALCLVFLVIFLAILLLIWLHPQKLRAENTIFKVPCVPWIPIISTLFNWILLFQLPSTTWALVFCWLLAGLTFYFLYGYRKSRLHMRLRNRNKTNNKNTVGFKKPRLRMPSNPFSGQCSVVYPQQNLI